MNKNDYIKELNKIKTTDSMKKRLLDTAQGKEWSDNMYDKKHTKIIGLVASLALFFTVGAIVLVLGMGSGGNSTSVAGSEEGESGKYVEQTTSEAQTSEAVTDYENILNDDSVAFDVKRDIDLSCVVSEDAETISVTITNKSEHLEYSFENLVTFSHLEGENYVATGVRQCINDQVESFTVKAGQSKNIVYTREDVSNTKELEDFLGSNVFGITFVCLHPQLIYTSAIIGEPVRCVFTVGDDDSINIKDELAVSITTETGTEKEDRCTTILENRSDEDYIFADSRRLLEYDSTFDVWFDVPSPSYFENIQETRELKAGESVAAIIDLSTDYSHYDFKDTEYCMTDYLTTEDNKIMYVESFRFSIEKGQKMFNNTFNESKVIIVSAEHDVTSSVSRYAIKATFKNESEFYLTTGADFYIRKYDSKNDKYIDIPMKEGAAWNALAHVIEPNAEYNTTLCLDYLYDISSLEDSGDGYYVIYKHFDYDVAVGAFTIEDGVFNFTVN